MKLYRKMMVEGCAWDMYSQEGDHAYPIHVYPRFKNACPSLICIDAHEAHKFLREQRVRYGAALQEGIYPPFGQYWIEWTAHDKPHQSWHGAIVLVDETNKDGVKQHEFHCCPIWFPLKADRALAGLCIGHFVVDADTGKVSDNGIETYESDEVYEYRTRSFDAALMKERDLHPEFQRWMMDVVVLTWFMHVRNVVYEPIRVSAKEQRQLRGKGDRAKRIDFRTLKISREIIRSSRQESSGNHRNLALHIVIGHFKYYPNGLFGDPNLKGTFFFHAHFRGDQKNGEVRKDYVA